MSIARVLLTAGLVGLAGCQIVFGIEQTKLEPDGSTADAQLDAATDANTPVASIRVRAAGVVNVLPLEVVINGVVTAAPVSADGNAILATGPVGAVYQVRFVGDHECVLGNNATGSLAGDVTVSVNCIGLTRLADLRVVTPASTNLGFAPGTFSYTVNANALLASASVTATANAADAVIKNGALSLASGVAFDAPTAGTTTLVVTHPAVPGLQTSYALNFARAATPVATQVINAFEPLDTAGWSVHSDDNRLIIGVPNEDSQLDATNPADNTVTSSGAAYVYKRVGGGWQFEAALKAPNPGMGDQFGTDVAIAGDWAVVSALFEDSNGVQSDNSVVDSGAVYFYKFVNNAWQFRQYVKGPNLRMGGQFGNSVAMSGNAAIVSAPNEIGGSFLGVVYVYERMPDENWVRVAALANTSGTGYGAEVALDGHVGAIGASHGSSMVSAAGAVHVIRRDAAGTWAREQVLMPPTARANDFFGGAVAIQGNRLVVGASEALAAGGAATSDTPGHAYVYEYNGTAWSLAATLQASNGDPDDEFGRSVAIDGDTIAVGALREDSDANGIASVAATDNISATADVGATYIYRRNANAWNQSHYVKMAASVASQRFGTAAWMWRGELFATAASAGAGAEPGTVVVIR